MFKAYSNFLHRTPWWALILFGFGVLLLLGLLATPFQIIGLQQEGDSPEQQQAIKREIDLTIGRSLLGVAERAVRGLEAHSSDPVRKAELMRTLQGIVRALTELERVRSHAQAVGPTQGPRPPEDLLDRAQEAYASAVDARERMEAAQKDIRAALRDGRIPAGAWSRSLDEMLNAARAADQRALDALEAARERTSQPTGVDRADLMPPLPALPPLPEGLREEIRDKVAGDLLRGGIGLALILAFVPLFVMSLIAKIFIDRARRSQELAEREGRRADAHDLSRQLTEARLQALQAQVEPHFLYNTLANVQALTETDPPAAHRMVGHLIQYLRAALPRMREAMSTVSQEVELAQAYLSILGMRMGERLSFAIEVDEAARALPFPPLMLPSLVENAVKHGLEPQRQGGHIRIVIGKKNGQLLLRVEDSGLGLGATGEAVGGGVGLANIRERLAALYGDAARLTLDERPEGGVAATVAIPAGSPARVAAGTADAAAPAGPQMAGRRIRATVSRAHNAWARAMSSTFVVLMVLLAVAFGVAFAELLAAAPPISIDRVELHGIESMVLGSLGLFAGFCLLALAALLAVAAIYGLGLLLAGLAVFVPLVVLISAFPQVAPVVLLGLAIYWYVRRTRKVGAAEAEK